MARMVGCPGQILRLIGSAFPYPLYSVSTRRPFFDEELQSFVSKSAAELRDRRQADSLLLSRCLDLPSTKTKSVRSGRFTQEGRRQHKNHLIVGLAGLGLSG